MALCGDVLCDVLLAQRRPLELLHKLLTLGRTKDVVSSCDDATIKKSSSKEVLLPYINFDIDPLAAVGIPDPVFSIVISSGTEDLPILHALSGTAPQILFQMRTYYT